MKKSKILSGSSSLPLLVFYLCVEIGCVLLCCFANVTYILLAFWTIMCVLMLLIFNRIVTIVTYDPSKKSIYRRGLFWGFRKELRIADIIRTEVRKISKEQEYILLIDKEMPYLNSLSPDMPIRVPNTVKGRAFVADLLLSSSTEIGDTVGKKYWP